jgi:hypothetical protein
VLRSFPITLQIFSTSGRIAPCHRQSAPSPARDLEERDMATPRDLDAHGLARGSAITANGCE